jgi:hypothetical protein
MTEPFQKRMINPKKDDKKLMQKSAPNHCIGQQQINANEIVQFQISTL